MVGHDVVVDQTGGNVGDNNFCLTCYVGGNSLSNKCFTTEFRETQCISVGIIAFM